MGRHLNVCPVPSDAPFANDKLDREQYADILTKLLLTYEEPFVLSVNSPWGTGKTQFVKMWKAKLEKEHLCLYFNAWENDDKDPFVSFTSLIYKYGLYISKIKKGQDKLKKTLERYKTAGSKLIAEGVVQTQQMFNLFVGDVAEDIEKKMIESVSSGIIDRVVNRDESIEITKNELSKLIDILDKHAYSKPLFIFVDELDRCRPTYAVKLLETINHYFDVENTVFVLSLDRKQLECTVRALYGNDMEFDGYLRRFINLEYNLPEPSPDQFIRHLFYNVFGMQKIGHFHEIHGENIDDVSSFDTKDPNGFFIGSCYNFFQGFGLTLREIEKCMLRLNISLRSIALDGRLIFKTMILLCILREKYSDIYYMVQVKSKTRDEIEQLIIAKYTYGESPSYMDIEELLILDMASSDQQVIRKLYSEAISEFNHPDNRMNRDIRYRAFFLEELMKQESLGESVLSDIIASINLTEGFIT